MGGIPPLGNPDDYAQQYANQNGITLDAAKAELRAKYGDPQPPQPQMLPQMFGNNQAPLWTGGMGTPVWNYQAPAPGFTTAPLLPEQMEANVKKHAEENGVSEKDAARALGYPDKDANRPAGTSAESTSSATTGSATTTSYSKKQIKSIQRELEGLSAFYRQTHKAEYKAKYSNKTERESHMSQDARNYALQIWQTNHPGETCPTDSFRYS